MARLDPSIRHAISPPEFGEGKLHREHLVDRLHGEIPRKLVAIAAPAGYGKTTLLADFVAHTELPTCWVHLTEADRDTMRLSSVLAASLERRFRRIKDMLDLQAYSGSEPDALARAFGLLVDENIPEAFVLILDEVHILHESDEVMRFADRLLDELPEQATVFAAGREVFEVSLAKLMAAGQLAGLGPHDLALSEDETRQLSMIVHGNELAGDELHALHQKTRGWVTGVLLSDYGPGAAAFDVGLPESMAYEYLASVVLNQQSDEMRRFMLDASVLPVLTGEVCDAILERSDSEERLAALSERGVFLSATAGTPRTYEFHPMFRDLLEETAQAANPDQYSKLRLRAAEILRDEDPETAVHLLLAIGEAEKAAGVADSWAETYYAEGRFKTLEDWLETFSSMPSKVPNLSYYATLLEYGRGHVKESFARLRGLLSSGELDDELYARSMILKGFALQRMGVAEEELAEVMAEAEDASVQVGDPLLLGLIDRLKARISYEIRGDFEEAIDLIDHSIGEIVKSGDRFRHADALQEKVRILALSGDVARARSSAEEALRIALEIGSPIGLSDSHNNLGHLDYLGGDFLSSLEQFEEAKVFARRASNPVMEARAIFGQADLFSDLGLTYQAAKLYEEGLEIATTIEDNYFIKYGCLGSCCLHRRNGGYRIAGEWLQRAMSLNEESQKAKESLETAAILVQSDPHHAIRELANILSSEETLSAEERVLLHYILACSHVALGSADDARRHFRESLSAASIQAAIQFISAELAFDASTLDWMVADLGEDPVLQLVLDRVELMAAVRRQYQDREGAVPSDFTALDVRALGQTAVTLRGEEITTLKPQALEVLLYLIDRGSAERDRLAEVFWPEHSVGRQTANLHMAVYSIRRELDKDAVLLDGTAYRMNPELECRYDVEEFERAAQVVGRLPPGDPRRLFALTEATGLYRGTFMPEFFSDWVQERRRVLELQFLDLASEHAQEAIRRDQPARAVQPLRDALSVDPYRDDLNKHYLEVLEELDRRTEILAHYQKYARLLEEELGLKPSQSITEIYEKVAGGG